MKEFTVYIGNKERRLRYTTRDGIALKKRFGKGVGMLCTQDVLGYGKDGSRTGETDPEAQVVLVTLGLQHDDQRVTEDRVADWFDEHLAAEKPLGELLLPAVKAAFFSGICTGLSVDIEKQLAETEAAETAAGKDQPATAPPAP